MAEQPFGIDPIRLFGDYMKVTGVPTLSGEGVPAFAGMTLPLSPEAVSRASRPRVSKASRLRCEGRRPSTRAGKACPELAEGMPATLKGKPVPSGVEGMPSPRYKGKKLGVVNGASWISLWSTYFGKTMLPGVKIINVCNEAVQLNFMEAHGKGLDCPPQINIDLFCKYARDLYDLHKVDAVMISCSTMNRAFKEVSETMKPLGVPVVQIDEAMMEQAASTDGKILVVATHGPTVKSTQALLEETADRLGRKVDFVGATIEEAFDLLGRGKIAEHNQAIAETIRKVQSRDQVDVVVLAQLSMSVFSFSFPEPVEVFGIPILNSGQTGFARAGEILKQL